MRGGGTRLARGGEDLVGVVRVETPALVGSLLDQHPRNRFPESARKFKISDDQARLLKVLKAEIPARQMVSLLRETCRKLDGHAIVDTTASGECSSEALDSLLQHIYSALAAPAEVSLPLLYSRYRSWKVLAP